ncbi:hypothetical protein JCM8097_006718 [Rhodosporidiobolus ruineniae]
MSSATPVGPQSLVVSFPKELLDQICEEVASGGKDATSTLRSWILTCRRFVSSGERVLYRTPFRSSAQRSSAHSVFTLLRTLETRPDLAAHVQDLEQLSLAIKTRVDKLGQDKAKGRKVLVWQHIIVQLCPQVTKLGICVTKVELKPLGIALAAATDLEKLVVRFPEWPIHSQGGLIIRLIDEVDIHMGGKRFSPPFLHFVLSREDWQEWTLLLMGRFGASLDTTFLRVDAGDNGVLCALEFFPGGIDKIRQLCLTSKQDDTDDLPELFEELGGERLLTLRSFTYRRLQLAPGELTAFPLGAFSAFPSIQKLSLRDGVDMSIDKLELLVNSSPLLVRLNLQGTVWDPSTSPSTVLSLLDRLPNLKYARLGQKPPSDAGDEILVPLQSQRHWVGVRWD